jgi:hypothetical protein
LDLIITDSSELLFSDDSLPTFQPDPSLLTFSSFEIVLSDNSRVRSSDNIRIAPAVPALSTAGRTLTAALLALGIGPAIRCRLRR